MIRRLHEGLGIPADVLIGKSVAARLLFDNHVSRRKKGYEEIAMKTLTQKSGILGRPRWKRVEEAR